MVAPSSWLTGTSAALRPPPKLSLSEWADEHFRLSAGSADEGRWTTRPYQREILNALIDPTVEWVSVIKSARIGWTEMVKAATAFFMKEDPCPILGVLPTVEIAEIYSREMLAPMLRDVPVLAELFEGSAMKTTGRTLLHKSFPGGVVSLVGANSAAGFSMLSRRLLWLDEVDRMPPSAGDEGDPVALAVTRTKTFWNRKILAGSTPTIAGVSRISELFEAGDQRRRYWPCPHCEHMDFLAFRERPDGRAHVMRWPDDRPDLACFECSSCHLPIDEVHKRDMDEAGEWRADAPGNGTANGKVHASFSIWTAYSSSPNAGWGQIASEFVEANKLGNEKRRVFINTVLGETWQERGEAPNWEGLYQRREPYKIGTVPAPVIVLTAGVDVQKDRLVYEVKGWASSKENWSIEAAELHGDTALEATEPGSPWAKLDELLGRSFLGTDERQWSIAMLAVDSGYNTQAVYNWARRYPRDRVIACKGVPGARLLVGATTAVDVTVRGKRIQRGFRMWPIGVDVGKSEFYGWLRLELGEDGTAPPGYCHFPEYDTPYFKQITAEHLVKTINKRSGRYTLEWQVLPNRENHWLDTAILARVAAAVLGIDRMPRAAAPAPPTVSPAGAPAAITVAPAAAPEQPRSPPAARSSFLGGGNGAPRRPGGWLGRRR